MQANIQHSFFFQQSPQIVWDYLTKPELIEQWLMKTDLQPIVGFDFQFTTKPLPNYNFNGIVYCKILEVIPLKKLTYSWKGGPGDGRITLDSIVEWTLTEKENGTELKLDHGSFKQVDIAIYSAMEIGWLKNIQKINELINSRAEDKHNR